jgi:hypothetical protein
MPGHGNSNGETILTENPAPRPAANDFERTYLDKLRLAAQVILDAAPGGDLVSDPLEVELDAFRDRVEFLLLLPPGTPAPDLPWRDGGGDPPRPRPATPRS